MFIRNTIYRGERTFQYNWALLPELLLDLYLNEISYPDRLEPGHSGDFFFFSSSYIMDFKILIWYSKSTQIFYVKCMSYIPSLFIAYPAKIQWTADRTHE